jgi:luciferase-type oxidoreductase
MTTAEWLGAAQHPGDAPPARAAKAPVDLAGHAGFSRCFTPGALTLGLILPLETHPYRAAPTMKDHLAMAQAAQALGFASLWMRDIPFYDPDYGDVGQIFEPLTYISWLAAHTTSIALGTAGIVLPLRDPLLLAKQVTTVDQLSHGRMLLGLSSGDRPSDYPLFGIDMATRGERLRDAFAVYRTVSEQCFPVFDSERFGRSEGGLDLVPKPPAGRTPAIAVGKAQQSVEWIAAQMDGFISTIPQQADLQALVIDWAAQTAASGQSAFRPLGIGGFVDLVEDRHHPLRRIQGGIRVGSATLADYLAVAREAGISHLAMNPKVSRRPYIELMEELASEVLSRFPTPGAGT